jgi:hypothetical protein
MFGELKTLIFPFCFLFYFFGGGGFSNENKSNKKQKWEKNVFSKHFFLLLHVAIAIDIFLYVVMGKLFHP